MKQKYYPPLPKLGCDVTYTFSHKGMLAGSLAGRGERRARRSVEEPGFLNHALGGWNQSAPCNNLHTHSQSSTQLTCRPSHTGTIAERGREHPQHKHRTD